MAAEESRPQLEPLSMEAGGEESQTPYHSLPDYGFDGGDGSEKDKLFGLLPSFSEARRKTFVSAMYLSLAAILGTFLRIALAQLFGEECANPGTVGWLAASSPLCVTKDGSSERQGGIVFADLPANLLGAFFMGLMQPGASLELPVNVNIAWASPSSFFQQWDIMHLAIRTGFCGSLTTFSSWNSEMVVMTFGTGDVSKTSQVVSAFFGYIIGMETALGSYVFGQKIALWIYRYRNPTVAREMDATRERVAQGVYINRELPEFERRYLPDLAMELEEPPNVAYLERWRRSTREARRVGHECLSPLCEIENAMLVKQEPFSPEAESVARKEDWDLDALAEWLKCNPRLVPEPRWTPWLFTVPVSGLLCFLVGLALVLGLIFVNDGHPYMVTYRTMIYAACLAPFGALLRWNLSVLNGTLAGDLSWIPLGTFCANVLGSVISITMIAFELEDYDHGFWTVGTMRAIKVGFSGCLTTVSTFVSEVKGLMNSSSQQYHAYLYILMSLMASFILSVVVYALVVFVIK